MASTAATGKCNTDLVAAGLLRGLRRRCGLTQAAMAEKAGVAESVISAYESGARQPSLGALIRLIEAVGHELRLNVVPADRHDELLEAATSPATLAAFRREQATYLARRRAEILTEDVFADILSGLPGAQD